MVSRSSRARGFARHLGGLWYLVWCAAVLGVACVLVARFDGSERVWIGAGSAIVLGIVFAWLASVGRRIQQEPLAVRVDLRTWTWVPVWTTLWAGGALIGGWAVVDDLQARSHHELASQVLGVAGVLLGGWFARLAGRPRSYLRVDVPAGVVEYVGPQGVVACSFDGLGRFEIVEHVEPYTGERRRWRWYRLVAPGLADIVLRELIYPERVRELQASVQQRIDALRDQSAVRRVLAETPTEGSGFRAAPDLAAAVREAVDDPARLRAALHALGQDPDLEIRQKAAAIRAT